MTKSQDFWPADFGKRLFNATGMQPCRDQVMDERAAQCPRLAREETRIPAQLIPLLLGPGFSQGPTRVSSYAWLGTARELTGSLMAAVRRTPNNHEQRSAQSRAALLFNTISYTFEQQNRAEKCRG